MISTGEPGVVIGVHEKGASGKPRTVPRDLSGGDQSLGPPDCLSAIDNHPTLLLRFLILHTFSGSINIESAINLLHPLFVDLTGWLP